MTPRPEEEPALATPRLALKPSILITVPAGVDWVLVQSTKLSPPRALPACAAGADERNPLSVKLITEPGATPFHNTNQKLSLPSELNPTIETSPIESEVCALAKKTNPKVAIHPATQLRFLKNRGQAIIRNL